MRYERLIRGFGNQTGVFLLDYQAPTLHFFERDRAVFDQLIDSFRVI